MMTEFSFLGKLGLLHCLTSPSRWQLQLSDHKHLVYLNEYTVSTHHV